MNEMWLGVLLVSVFWLGSCLWVLHRNREEP